MKTKNLIILIAMVTVIGLLIFGIIIKRDKPDHGEPGNNLPKGQIVVGEIASLDECNITVETLRPYESYQGTDGIKTTTPSNYKPGMSFVEMCFLKRDINGNLEPYPVESFGLSPIIGSGPTIGMDGMSGIRIGVTNDPNAHRNVNPGKDYRISHYWLEGQAMAIHTEPLMPAFHVPEDLPPNSVYRVKLVIKDEILEKELLARKEAEKKERERIAEEEKITVTFGELPSKSLVVLYQVGDNGREAPLIDPNAKCVEIKGPNKLGGELAVFRIDSLMRCWAYIKNLQKRNVTLPKDADIIYEEKDLVDLTITLQDKDVTELAKQQAVAFYASAEAKLPLFGISLKSKLADMPTDGPKELLLKIIPGTYYARVGEPMKDGIPLGTVTINETGPNKWVLKLPVK